MIGHEALDRYSSHQTPLSKAGIICIVAWLIRGDSRATFCGDSADSRPKAWNGRSAIWRHNEFLRAGPVHDQDNENDVHAAKSHAKCALKDNLLTSVGTATLTSYSDDITLSKRS